MIRLSQPLLIMEEVSDADELAKGKSRRDRFERNMKWYEDHIAQIDACCRGKHICIAGEELFTAGSANEALSKAMAAHPDDDGFFVKYVYKERMNRIYAF